MHKRRYSSIMLTFILFVSLIIGNCSDVKALVIKSRLPLKMKEKFANYELFSRASVDVQEAEVLDTVTLSVEVNAKGVKLQKNAYAVYTLVGENTEVQMEMNLELKNGVYKKSILVDESFIPGIWKLDYVVLKDESGHTEIVYNKGLHNAKYMESFKDLSAADFRVGHDDFVAGIQSVEIIDEEVDGVYRLKVTPKDDKSGLAENAYALYESEDGENKFEKEVKLTLIDGVFEGKFKVDDYKKPIYWNLSYVVFRDKNENVGVFYNEMIHGEIPNGVDMSKATFITSGEDVEGPEFMGMTISQKEFDINNNLNITVDVQVDALDKRGKLNKYANLLMRNEDNKAMEVRLELIGDSYKGKLYFYEENAGEKWFVDFLVLSDEGGNKTVVYNSSVHGIGEDLSQNNIDIKGINIGIKRVNVDNRDMSLTKKVAIEVETVGIRGEGYGYVLYKDYNGNEKEIKLSGKDNMLRGYFEDITEGTWNMSYVLIHDSYGNREIIYNSFIHGDVYPSADLSGAMIEVEFPIPTIESVKVSQKEVTLYDNEVVKLEVVVKNKEYAGYNAYVKYTGENLEREYKLNRLADKFIGEITVDSKTQPGEMKIDYIILKDLDGNSLITYNSDLHGFGKDFSSGDVVIKNPEVNINILSVESADELLDIGESTVVRINVDKSVIELKEKGFIAFLNENTLMTKEIEVQKVSDQMYEGIFTVNSVEELGTWKFDYAIISDQMDNSKVVYNADVHDVGEKIPSPEIKAGSLSVYSKEALVLERGRDLRASYYLRDFSNEGRMLRFDIEARDSSGKVISKIRVNKYLRAGEQDEVQARMKLSDDVHNVRINIVDGRGDIIYKLADKNL